MWKEERIEQIKNLVTILWGEWEVTMAVENHPHLIISILDKRGKEHYIELDEEGKIVCPQ